MTEAETKASRVPDLGPDPLKDFPDQISTGQAEKRRAAVARLLATTQDEERTLRAQRAATLLDEIDALNGNRLTLLPHLSSAKRNAITGFSAAGFDQARSEARQLFLILRYHRHIVLSWLSDLPGTQRLRNMSWWHVATVAVPWLLLILAFAWWRGRSAKFLALAEERLAALDRAERRPRPALLRRLLRVLRGFHRSLEWLLFLALSTWLLPASAEGLLEVQLFTVIVGWTLSGALIVNLINAVATLNDARKAHPTTELASLRLRSLRLVGRVVVAFALVLVVSARLVGHGTVYSWVWSTCWFAGLPVFLILVRWWRDTVFARVERVRRKSTLQGWLLANRNGWKSFFAAMIAAVQLFSVGAYKTARNWLTGFEVAQRAHAYLFKRELARLASGRTPAEARPLRGAVASSLSPDNLGAEWLECPADERCAELAACATARSGGLTVLIGARGLGKSATLRRLQELVPETLRLDCQPDWSCDDFKDSFQRATNSASPSQVLVDDAHLLMQPVLGGLRSFDDVLSFARANSAETSWVFAMDASLWPFLQRARDARPLFDRTFQLEPWHDEQIGTLLKRRDEEAGISPTFEDLLEQLPRAADEVDKMEALAARQLGYFRMVWDYTGGNPGLALQVWRGSLTEDAAGAIRVTPLDSPDAAALESLPDSALFILRAVLQMGPANPRDVARATRVPQAQVDNALSFGRSHGYLSQTNGRVQVTWRWLRAVTALLERRHLLVNP